MEIILEILSSGIEIFIKTMGMAVKFFIAFLFIAISIFLYKYYLILNKPIPKKILKSIFKGKKVIEEKVDKRIIKHNKNEYLTTENERKFFYALKKAIGEDYLIHCQTSLIAIVEPIEYKDKSRAWSKRVDFVITDNKTKIIAVIELDDSSHNKANRIKRDKYVNNALEPHHPLIRFNTEKFYKPEKIAEILAFHITK